jgi:hypothetical protein
MRRWNRQLIVSVMALLCVPSVALAQVESSTSYSAVETELGAEGQLNSGSTSYSLKPGVDDGGAVLGQDTSSANSKSTSYQTNAGYDTTAQPGLTFIVNTSNVNLGTLSTALASTGTATFSVKDYTSSGYMVTMVGTTPINGSHAMTHLASDTASAAGSEQFGVNMVSNSSPVSVGANPVQMPSASFSFGVAGDGLTNHYIQTGFYRFNSGEVVASSPKTSGETDYTMSFLANISNSTPGGTYQGNITLIATGSY